jgi:Sulfotransferase domain
LTRHFLIIGAQRCGTTYLHSMLDAHPEITMARPARPEPKVFLSDERADKGIDWYRESYFGHATTEPLLGEKCTSYIEDPKAPARAARVLGDAQIVVLLRDPVQRAVSNWRFSTENRLEDRPLETALRENLAGEAPWDPTATSVSPFAYLERGRYADYLGAWFATFPSGVHVCFLQDLMGDETVLAGLFASLGVDPGFRPTHRDQAVNQSEEPAPALPSDLLLLLEEYFESSNVALSRLLERDLPWWTETRRGVTRG